MQRDWWKASSNDWSPEPEASLARGLIGADFAHVSDTAARLVSKHWLKIEALAHGAVPA
jgi:hypothetical protein